MVTTLGVAVTGYATTPRTLDLPRPTGGLPSPHRPWCSCCKRTHHADDLDTAGMCSTCARVTAARAVAAERRRLADEADAAAAKPPKPAKVKAERKPRTPRPPRAPRPPKVKAARPGPRGVPIDETAIVEAYVAGDTIPQLAKQWGVGPNRVRAVLDRRGIERRDDRANRSGGRLLVLSDDQLATIRRLYVDDGLPVADIATRLGHSRRLITRVLTEQEVTIRPPASERRTDLDDTAAARLAEAYANGAAIADLAHLFHVGRACARRTITAAGVPIRRSNSALISDRLEDLGITSRQVKDWAHAQGLAGPPAQGSVAVHLIEAYAAAHQPTHQTTTREPS